MSQADIIQHIQQARAHARDQRAEQRRADETGYVPHSLRADGDISVQIVVLVFVVILFVRLISRGR